MKNSALEKNAPLVATGVALSLAIIKLIVGIISGSVALLSSAVDSLLDTGVSIFNYFAIKFSKDPADREHNYGHGKMEGIAATFEWIIITLSGLYIIYESVIKIITPEPIKYINWTLVVMLISILATGWLVYFLNSVYKKTKNLVIKWDALHYKMDFFTNIAVIITLAILFFFPTLGWIDWVVWWFIWIYIIIEAYKLIMQWTDLLLDKILTENEDIRKIIQMYVDSWEIQSFHCLKTRAWGSHDKFVEFHFVMPPETTILKAHDTGDKIEDSIELLDTKSRWHIVWHIDPYDDSKTDVKKAQQVK